MGQKVNFHLRLADVGEAHASFDLSSKLTDEEINDRFTEWMNGVLQGYWSLDEEDAGEF